MKRARWFGHPAIIALLAGLLVTDYVSIPGGITGGPSTIKSAVTKWWHDIVGVAWATGPRNRFPGLFLTKDDEVELLWYYGDASNTPAPTLDDLSSLVNDGWLPIGGASTFDDRRSGFYHITERWTAFTLHAEPDEELAQRLMARYVQRFDSLPPAHEVRRDELFQKIRLFYGQGTQYESAPLVSGYLRNGVAIAMLALLVLLPIRGRTDLWLVRWHHLYISRPKPGHCSVCGYDASDLETCPECGSKQPTS
ncbi:MAG: hypothetical protein AAFV77_10985 [Planctomycetota bacterium]